MKTIAAIWTVCLTLLICSFSLLLVADRKLGVPLPYSVPIAFACMLVIAPLLFFLANKVRSRRAIVVHVTPMRPAPEPKAEQAPAVPSAPRRAEGVVLLDFSNAPTSRKGRAA